jgi:glyoxylase-like metal-dependent hydrolase (beta-lactamase superfamily II)
MFNVQRIECNPLQENCYVVSDESRECVIIDCGAMYEEELAALDHYIADNQLKPLHLLATHGHLDHNFGNAHMFLQYGLKVEICAEDQDLVERLPEQARDIFGIEIPADQPSAGRLLGNGDVITFGSHQLQVLQTPGHTHGSCLFYCAEEHTAFTGDTLFRMSISRTDFAEGSWAEMEKSLRDVVSKLPKETIVLSGHGPQSTIADELRYNPYLR